MVKSRYFDSKSLYRPNAQNLFDKLLEVTRILGIATVLQLSMDGPNVNWEVLNILHRLRQEGGYAAIFDIGSCGLHIIHGAFKTGFKSQGWELDKILKAMHWLFEKSTARREVYMRLCDFDKFAFEFFSTR